LLTVEKPLPNSYNMGAAAIASAILFYAIPLIRPLDPIRCKRIATE
jgi:hypothetical protein